MCFLAVWAIVLCTLGHKVCLLLPRKQGRDIVSCKASTTMAKPPVWKSLHAARFASADAKDMESESPARITPG